MNTVMKNKDLVLRTIFFVIGFAPITALSVSVFGLIPLHMSTPLCIVPAIAFGFTLLLFNAQYRAWALEGLLSGLIAVAIYDCFRIPVMLLGGWPDFIPKIGSWLLDRPNVHWLVGYLWRYLGNGAGMGLSFMMIVPLIKSNVKGPHLGIMYGIGIWCCLIGTLIMSPHGEEMLFQLNLSTFVLSLIGHIIYGGTLGILATKKLSSLLGSYSIWPKPNTCVPSRKIAPAISSGGVESR